MGSVRTEEPEILNNSKYRQYVAAVDKALKAFEYTTEWADLIAALGKLNKVFSANAKFGANIPKPVTVAKRLSQCLHPALPSGVHLKALETYRQIFTLLGKDELPKLLYLFSVGLFPLLGHAGIKVRMELLKLYETFLIPLGPALRPACVGLLTGLLPGLEEGSEFFDKSNFLLEQVLYGVGPDYFYSCLWQCIRSSPSVRLPALVFVSSHFDKNKAMDDQLFIMGSSIDNMVGALCVAASDQLPLVQRHLLDFMCFAFPLDSEHLVKSDQIRLLQSCLFVLLRRDMSLNRRLYSWLIGSHSFSTEGDTDMTYFVERALPLIFEALNGLLNVDLVNDNTMAVRILRLLLYLLDKSEIGPKVLERSLLQVLIHIEEKESAKKELNFLKGRWKRYRGLSSSAEEKTEEIGKNLNLLLNSLDPGFVWNYLGDRLRTIADGQMAVSLCKVVRYLLGVIQLDSHTDIRSQQLPKLLLRLVSYGEKRLKNLWSKGHYNYSQEFLEILSVGCDLLREIQQASGAVELKNPEVQSESDSKDRSESLISHCSADGSSLSTELIGTEGQAVVERCLQSFLRILPLFLNWCLSASDEVLMSVSERRQLCGACFELLKEFSEYPLCGLLITDEDEDCGFRNPDWVDALMDVCLGRWASSLMVDFQVESWCLAVMMYMMVVSHSVVEQCDVLRERRLAEEARGSETFHPVFLRPLLPTMCLKRIQTSDFYKNVAKRLWKKLDSEHSTDHEEAAKLFSMLHSCQLYTAYCSDAQMECLKDLTSSDESVRYEAAEKFHRLWSLTRNSSEELSPGICMKPFSRVVLMMLSSLTTSRPTQDLVSEAAWCWFQDCLQHGDVPRLLHILCLILIHPSSSRISIQYLSRSLRNDRSLCRQARKLLCLRCASRGHLYHLTDSITPCGDIRTEANLWLMDIKRQLLTEVEMGTPSPSDQPRTVGRGWGMCFDDELEETVTLADDDVLIPCSSVDSVVQQMVKELVDKVCETLEFSEPIMHALEEASVGSEAEETDGLSEGDIAELRKGGLDRNESVLSSPSVDLKFFDGIGEQKGVELRAGENGPPMSDLFHPLHAHFLLYTEGGQVECGRSEMIFSCLSTLLNHPDVGKLVASCLASTSTGSSRNAQSLKVAEWMARHVKAILGKDFWRTSDSEERENSDTASHKNYMFLELFLTISLYYLRSYHLNSPVSLVRRSDLEANWRAKVACLEFLDSLISQLSKLMEELGKSFATYVGDVMMKCKFQKCLLHCMMASAHEGSAQGGGTVLSVDVTRFNCGTSSFRSLRSSYQRALLSLVGRLTELEFMLKHSKSTQNPGGSALEKLSVAQQMSPMHSSLVANCPLVELRLFLLTVLNALKRRFEMHDIWLRFLVRSLPFLERSLPSVTVHVSEQLSKNLQLATEHCYELNHLDSSPHIDFPTNYMYTVLEALTALFHHCLSESGLPSSSSQLPVASLASVQVSGASASGLVEATKNATGEILNNLVKVFTFSDGSAVNANPVMDKSMSFVSLARTELLGAFPHILSTLCDVWSAVKENKKPKVPVGLPQHIRRLMLDLLSPIAVNHSSHFLSSMALVWLTKGTKRTKVPSPSYSVEQLDIADLLLSIKMFPFETLLNATGQTLKEPVRIKNIDEKDVFPIDVSLLEIVHGCLLSCPMGLLRTSWASLHKLLMDSLFLNLQPTSLFLTFFILTDYVRKCCGSSSEDRSTLRGMQDVCIRITDSLNGVIGWQLEQTTWLKRTLVVKNDNDIPGPGASLASKRQSNGFVVHYPRTESVNSMEGASPGRASSVGSDGVSRSESGNLSKDTNNNKRDAAFSTQALLILAEHLSAVIDMICKSEDKERLLPTLHGVWNNVQPYLRTRNERNARNFFAASKFLASLSHFSYSRPVWKKATLELLTDAAFFRMDVESLRCWLTVVDNLMTHDKGSFKELLNRIAVSQGPSLFTSKDQEYEMRAGALKRLAFVLLSSEVDQYQPHLPDIQERLTENLRLFQVPHVHAQVFLCLRVLLIRLSPNHLTSIWPVLVTELVQVLLQIEQDLADTPLINSDYKCARDDQWLQLYLSTSKLLDALCVLPSWHLAQFQMFQWAFASSVQIEADRDVLFSAHVTRISELMKGKYGIPRSREIEGAPLLSQIRSIAKLKDLRFFFYDLANPDSVSRRGFGSVSSGKPIPDSDSTLKMAVETLESSLYVDFMENWQ